MRLTAIVLMMVVTLFFATALGSAADPQAAAPNRAKLMNPAQLNETAPDTFQVKFDTTQGEVTIEVTRAWSPNGADRFYNLVKNGYYDNCRFYRVLDNFMAQIGINGDPKINAVLNSARIKDDPVVESNKKGYVTYAKSSLPNSRTTQIFINYKNNSNLDGQGFSPFGKVIEGMKVVESLYSGYGEGAPNGNGPSQPLLQSQGNAYLEKDFPKLDYIKTATIVTPEAK
jgi:peptidyl-prolyl cis-trans isomerase A (cyclophilin A)